MFVELSILETIASVSQALHQYERAGGFASSTVLETAEAVPEESTAGTESVSVMSALPPTSEARRHSSPGQLRQLNLEPPPQPVRQRMLST
jgi:hypothetical protein